MKTFLSLLGTIISWFIAPLGCLMLQTALLQPALLQIALLQTALRLPCCNCPAAGCPAADCPAATALLQTKPTSNCSALAKSSVVLHSGCPAIMPALQQLPLPSTRAGHSALCGAASNDNASGPQLAVPRRCWGPERGWSIPARLPGMTLLHIPFMDRKQTWC